MTLLLAHIDRQNALLVSDRRLTSSATWQPVDDDTTKTIWLPSRAAAFAYTGLATIPSPVGKPYDQHPAVSGPMARPQLPADVWFSVVAGEHLELPMPDLLAAVGNALTTSLRRLHYRVPNRQLLSVTFIGVAWNNVTGSNAADAELGFQPVLWMLSNSHDARFQPQSVEDSFVVTNVSIRQTSPWLRFGSKPLPQPVVRRATAGLRKCYRRPGKADPAAVSALMVDTVRQAAMSDQTIGRGVLVTSIPRPAGEAMRDGGPATLDTAAPTLAGASFQYLPKDDDKLFDIAPTVVAPGGIIIERFSVSGLRPDAHVISVGGAPEEDEQSEGDQAAST